MRKFEDLYERELLALAIDNEEEDGRIYADFADGLVDDYPSTPSFNAMATEEKELRRVLIEPMSKNRRAHPAGAPPGYSRLHSAKTGLADGSAPHRDRAHPRP